MESDIRGILKQRKMNKQNGVLEVEVFIFALGYNGCNGLGSGEILHCHRELKWSRDFRNSFLSYFEL